MPWRAAAGVLAALGLGALLAARPAAAAVADPPREEGRLAGALSAAQAAEAELALLDDALRSAIDAARQGSAGIVQGDEPPGPPLERAAALAEEASRPASAAAERISELRGRLAALLPAGEALPPGADVAELLGIASQLRESATAAEPFVARRLASEETLAQLSEALEALDDDDPRAALAALERADAALAVVAAWEEPPRVLPLWLETTADLLAAAHDLARAAIDGDPAAAKAAAAAYEAAAGGAREADVALALAISETGASLTAVPLRRLADAARSTAAQRAAVASVLQTLED